MSSIDVYLKELQRIHNNLPKIIEAIIMKNQGEMLKRLKLRLYNNGVDAEGKEITPTYAAVTIEIKAGKGQRKSHVTLRDTGAFYAGMYLFIKEDKLFVLSSDPKTPSLIHKYGEDILGLTIQEQEYLINAILEPEVQKLLNQLPDIDVMTIR